MHNTTFLRSKVLRSCLGAVVWRRQGHDPGRMLLLHHPLPWLSDLVQFIRLQQSQGELSHSVVSDIASFTTFSLPLSRPRWWVLFLAR